MQQLVHHAAHRTRHLLALDAVESGQPVVQPQQFGVDEVGGALTKSGDRGGHLGDPLAGQIGRDFLRHDLPGRLGVVGGGAGRGLALHTLHVHDHHPGQAGYGGVDVARHAEVAQNQGLCVFVAVRIGERVMDVGERDDGPHRAGATDHQIGAGECGGKLIEGHGARPDTLLGEVLGEVLGARQRAVDDVDVADAGAHQMSGGEAAHRAGTDDGGAPPGQSGVGRPQLRPVEPCRGDVQRHRDHAGSGGVDRGLVVHPLAHRERALGEIMQDPADGLIGFRGGVGAAHLAEHLLLADDRAVQAAGHSEEVLHGCFAVAHVGVFGQLAHRQAGVLGEHLTDGLQTAVERVDDRVDLHPVAGRQHHRLGDQRRLEDLTDQLGLIGFAGRQPLEHADRCASVRHPEQQDAHSLFT